MWHSKDDPSLAHGVRFPVWLAYATKDAAQVMRYELTARNAPYSDTDTPMEWELQGRVNGAWRTFDKRAGQVGWGHHECRSFSVDTSGGSQPCHEHRLLVKSVRGRGNGPWRHVAVAELTMYGR